MKRASLLALVLAFGLVASACGDDDTATTTPATTSTTTTSAAGSAPTTANPTPTSSAPGTTGGASTPGASADIGALTEVFSRTPARLTYTIGGTGDPTTLVLAQDPTAVPPIESIQQPDEGLKIILSADATIVCDPSGGCFEVPGGAGIEGFTQSFLGPLVGSYLALAEQTGSAIGNVETTTETIAGRSGVCFSFTPNATGLVTGDTEFVRQCIDGELGFTLLLEAKPSGGDLETVLLLVDYAPPTDEDFEPTGPIQGLPQP